jgi:hypothetical protein
MEETFYDTSTLIDLLVASICANREQRQSTDTSWILEMSRPNRESA